MVVEAGIIIFHFSFFSLLLLLSLTFPLAFSLLSLFFYRHLVLFFFFFFWQERITLRGISFVVYFPLMNILTAKTRVLEREGKKSEFCIYINRKELYISAFHLSPLDFHQTPLMQIILHPHDMFSWVPYFKVLTQLIPEYKVALRGTISPLNTS